VTDGWFSFERAGNPKRPDDFQSQDLDSLFLESADVRLNAAWCISIPTMRLIFFWGDRCRFNVQTEKRGRFGYYVRRFKPYFQHFVAARSALLSSDVTSFADATPIKYIGLKYVDDRPAEIYAGNGFIFVYEMEPDRQNYQPDFNIRAYLLERSELGFKICNQAHRFFERVPKHLLTIDASADTLFEQFFSPNCFDLAIEPNVPFAWPWQKSLELRHGLIMPKQIPTISLVMDIRNSSSAMLLTRDPPRFAGFIDQAVEGAREAITQNGGYFDKETGDGVVGHFASGENIEDELPLKDALVAAKSISIMTTRLCGEYQENLRFSLGALGCAIGLFADRAVWLYSWRGVRAIGGSVVNASRICANARPREVGYCNTIAQLIKTSKITPEIFPLNGITRQIKIHEVREDATPEAIFATIS
jgi:class 3 adenylate cyclase